MLVGENGAGKSVLMKTLYGMHRPDSGQIFVNGNEEKIDAENASPQDLIDSGFSAIKTQVKSELLERLKQVDPYYFEKIILKLFLPLLLTKKELYY